MAASPLKSTTSWCATNLPLMGGLLAIVAVASWCLDGDQLEHTFSGVQQRHLSSVRLPRPQPGGPPGASCANVCGSVTIPYPFGLTSECARNRDFELHCKNISVYKGLSAEAQTGYWPFLTTARGSYTDNNTMEHFVKSFQVLSISGNNGTLIIDTTAIKAMSCNGSLGGNASVILPADGPYRLSGSNIFFVVGCSSGGLYSNYPITGTYFSREEDTLSYDGARCENSCSNEYTYNFCNYYACCATSLTPELGIYLMGGGISYADFPSVLYPPTFWTDGPGQIGRGTYGLELVWALQVNRTQYPNCSTLNTKEDYACSPPPAVCVDYFSSTTNLTGYYCKCTAEGFEGDGYLNGTGCKDVDECSKGSHLCATELSCINLIGSYNCTCPALMMGDGFTNGTRCDYIDFCKEGVQNDCTEDAYCSRYFGIYTCKCPRNMEGDGRVSGTGCKSKSHTALIAGLSAAGVLLFFIINGVLIWWLYRKRQRDYLARIFGSSDFSRREFLQEIQSKEGANICKLFTLDELAKATNNFSIDRVLGSGGFGTVYEGTLDDGTNLAIKKAKRDVGGGCDDTKQFINEVTVLSQVNHWNLVRLLGCCLETPVPVLVYEFISNGNLQEHLQRPNATLIGQDGHVDPLCPPPLDWNKRLKIAIGTAEALTYLHSGTSPPIYHRDVKTANILLDEKYVAKVADFGLSKFVPLEATHLSTAIQGTPGYLDPEYFDNYQITDKSDVYSFGVVLLELVTSEKPVDLSRQAKDHNLALRRNRLLKHGRLEDIIDPHLGTSSNPEMLEVVHSVAQVAMKCLERSREDRPTMKEVLDELQIIGKLTREHADTDKKKKLKPHKSVRFDDDSVSLVDGMSTNSQDFYLSSDLPSSSSQSSNTNLLSKAASKHHDRQLELLAR